MFKIKYNFDKIIDQYKTKLVVRGYLQMKNINYDETFAFTLKFKSLKLLFVLTIYLNLLIHQLNVNNAYFNSDLYDEIYIIISLKYSNAINDKVFRLLKKLYDLKQSTRIWNMKFEKIITKMKFKFIFSNKYIYIWIINSKLIIVAFYIDDIFIFTIIEILINIIKNNIKIFFKMKDFDLIDKIFDIQIHRIIIILTFD